MMLRVLEQLHIQNFRGFDDHNIPLRKLTVIVGANNAGKSTAAEALRLVALVVSRFRRGGTQFVAVPEWLDHPQAFRGVAPALRGRARVLEDHGPATFHRYGEPPAVLSAQFSSGSSVSVFIGPGGEIHGVARDADGAAVGTPNAARGLGLTGIAIQPQVAPLLREERVLMEETVRRGEGTHLAPQHFRNQLLYFDSGYADFCAMAENSWPGLEIIELEGDVLHPQQPLQLRIRDGDFVGEVSLMGHGLQVWLQTVWFLARADREATVVLDEPDVYLHPDLQRRLLGLVRDRFDQLLITTHSIEVVSDVDPGSILSIDRRRSESRFVTSLPGVQEVIDALGGVHNIQLARLFRSRTFLLVEGDDLKLLRILQAIVSPDAAPLDLIPNADLGGRGGWLSRLPARLPRRNAEGQNIATYCIIDRDYFPDEEINERYAQADEWRVRLWVWQQKELENYLLVPGAISRLISARSARAVLPPDTTAVAGEIDRLVNMRRDQITDAFAHNLFARNKQSGISAANRQARDLVAESWTSRDSRWAVAPGKEIISQLAAWSQENFGVSFGPEQVARVLNADEVAYEVRDVLTAVGSRGRLPVAVAR